MLKIIGGVLIVLIASANANHWNYYSGPSYNVIHSCLPFYSGCGTEGAKIEKCDPATDSKCNKLSNLFRVKGCNVPSPVSCYNSLFECTYASTPGTECGFMVNQASEAEFIFDTSDSSAPVKISDTLSGGGSVPLAFAFLNRDSSNGPFLATATGKHCLSYGHKLQSGTSLIFMVMPFEITDAQANERIIRIMADIWRGGRKRRKRSYGGGYGGYYGGYGGYNQCPGEAISCHEATSDAPNFSPVQKTIDDPQEFHIVMIMIPRGTPTAMANNGEVNNIVVKEGQC